MGFFKTKRVALSTIGADSPLAPPHDEEFSRRYRLVGECELPLYFGKVPVALIKPFAPDFRPSEVPPGSEIVVQITALITSALSNQESTPPVWVYPGDECYVLSDDYLAFAAYASLGVEHLPCLIMGEPTIPGPIEVIGPAPAEFVNRVTGRE